MNDLHFILLLRPYNFGLIKKWECDFLDIRKLTCKVVGNTTLQNTTHSSEGIYWTADLKALVLLKTS